ncbi:hypothetical protein TNCV_5038741 [Trichonephila clavipes]|nr:hypothetical protein TNCV_5038741 [Trichonephila clavipes]
MPANPYVQYPLSLRADRQLLCDDMVHCVHEKELQTHRASKKTHVCTTTKQDASPNENTATCIPVPFNDVLGMIAATPFSPDEYAMRIATQTESALICKEYSSPFIVSPVPVFPAPQRTPSPMGRR